MGDFLEEMNLQVSLNENYGSFSPLEEASMSCKLGSSFTEAQRSGPQHAGLEAGLFLPSVTLLFDLSSVHPNALPFWEPGPCSFGGFAVFDWQTGVLA